MSNSNSIPKNVFSYIWFILKRYRFSFLISILASLIGSVCTGVIFPWLVKDMTNALKTFDRPKEFFFEDVGIYFVYIFVAYFIYTAFFWLNILTRRRYMPLISQRSDRILFDHLQGHSYRYFTSQLSGKLAAKVRDASRSMHSLVSMLTWTVLPFVTLVIFNLVLFVKISGVIAAILGSWLFMHIGILLFSIGKWTKVNAERAEVASRVSGHITDAISNNLSVKLFSARHAELRNFKEMQEGELKAVLKVWDVPNLLIFKLDLVHLFLYAGLLAYMGYGYMYDLITLGDILFVFIAKNIINNLLWGFTWQLPSVMDAVGTIRSALGTFTKPMEVQDIPNAAPLVVNDGAINIKDLELSFDKSKVLRKLNLDIKGGEKLGIVGLSGAGKTTLVNLILRLFDACGGTIEIDGQNIRDVQQESLRSKISFVPQEAVLFYRTLAENIAYGKLDASMDEIVEASKLAHAHDFIMETENQYQTEVGERGIKLSGGQRQRIAIARAFLKDAPLLILDEATSALDTNTERVIQDSLGKLMEGRTTIAIAHRLSTLSQMERIIVLEQGRIVESGTHDELLLAKGLYAGLWQMQSGGFLPS